MVYNIKGEVAVQKGLGLPLLTTVERTAYTPSNDGFKVFDTDLNQEFTYHSGQWNGSTADATRTFESINQVSHGFSVTNAVYHDGTDWKGAQALDNGTAVAQGIVTNVIDVDNFEITTHGIATVTGHGLTVGEYYWLDQNTAGAVTATQPSIGGVQSLFHVRDANSILVDIGQALIASDATTLEDISSVQVSRTLGQLIPQSVSTVIQFDTTDWNIGSDVSVGTNRLDINTDGRYIITASGGVSAGATAFSRAIVVRLNGVDEIINESQIATSFRPTVVKEVDLVAGDYVELLLYHVDSARNTEVSEFGKPVLTVRRVDHKTVIPASSITVDTAAASDGDFFVYDATNQKLIKAVPTAASGVVAAADLNLISGPSTVTPGTGTSPTPSAAIINTDGSGYVEYGKLRFYNFRIYFDHDSPFYFSINGALDIGNVTCAGGWSLGGGDFNTRSVSVIRTNVNELELNRDDDSNVDMYVDITLTAIMA